MRYKKKLILLLLVIVVLTAIQYTLPYNQQLVFFYDRYIFHPYQNFRTIIFGFIPVSIGDLLYITGGFLIVFNVGKWLYYLLRLKKQFHELLSSMLYFVIIVCTLYILFVIGWGGNYYKQSLSTYWQLDRSQWSDTTTLVNFDQYLVAKLNEYAPHYRAAKFKDINREAKEYYRLYTDARTKKRGIGVKPSVFGSLMEYLAIQGYYNPFTGEAQVNKSLPDFMLPFVVCHEMAHQAGIAAEDDANLLSFAIATKCKDSSFNYSAYFNIWLYANSRLRMLDSTKAREIKSGLNPLSISHLDTLRAIRRRYRGDFSDYSGALYDGYLKLHNQRKGINSYNEVVISADALEQKRLNIHDSLIKIP